LIKFRKHWVAVMVMVMVMAVAVAMAVMKEQSGLQSEQWMGAELKDNRL
jgi:hypothetical protein